MEEIVADPSLLNGHRNPALPPLSIDQVFKSTSNFVVIQSDDRNEFYRAKKGWKKNQNRGVGIMKVLY